MVVMAMPSCSDTWDEHYHGGEGVTATKTLWEQIQANENLSRFANIAEHTTYYKDEKHPLVNPETNQPYTFKDMLCGTQMMTIWAPENAYLTAEREAELLELAKTSPYSAHQQFMANCIALFRQTTSDGGSIKLQMLNGKNMIFDRDNKTMYGIEIDDNAKNIPATNGTLHALKGVLPFNYNIYEYIKDANNAAENDITLFHQYVLNTDTTYFNESGSIQGNPDINGNPTYVDSAYINTNTMFFGTKRLTTTNSEKNLTYMESFGANVVAEDSDFVMVIPTDQAWEKAYNDLKPLYKYAAKYLDNDDGANNVVSYREVPDVDSLTNQSINMDIISPLCFNAHKQPKLASSGPLWTAQGIMNAADGDLKYILNTYGDTLRTDDTWQKTSLWNGKKQVEMSNGVGVITDEWNFPRKLYQPNLNIEIGWQSFYSNPAAAYNSYSTLNIYSFSKSAATKWDPDTVGSVSFDNFYEVTPKQNTQAPAVSFKLRGTNGENQESEVMSGTYDIYLVCVPDFYKTSSDTIQGDTIRHRITATLYYNDGVASKGGKEVKAELKRTENVIYEGRKVEAIKLFSDFTFPVSYKNLRYSYPTLTIGTYCSSTEYKATPYPIRNNLCFDRIILVAKDGTN